MKVGDLVYVAKPTPCCGNREDIDKFFIVDSIGSLPAWASCQHCGKPSSEKDFASRAPGWRWRVSRLRVIPPLNELEAEKAVETV